MGFDSKAVQFCFDLWWSLSLSQSFAKCRFRRVLQNVASYFCFSWGPYAVAFSLIFSTCVACSPLAHPLGRLGPSLTPLSLVGLFIKPVRHHEAWTNTLEHYRDVLHPRKSEMRKLVYQETRKKETFVLSSYSIYIRMPLTWSWTGNLRSVLCFVFGDTLQLSRGGSTE